MSIVLKNIKAQIIDNNKREVQSEKYQSAIKKIDVGHGLKKKRR